MSGLFPPIGHEFDACALQVALALTEGLARTVCIARVLIASGRTVDLAGLSDGVGLLCAKALDLPPDAGRSVRPGLIALLAETDLLAKALHDQAAA